MSDFEYDSFPENDWDGCGDLAWNEFDWEHYLREQDDVLHRYLGHYESAKGNPERIDEVARLMGWDDGEQCAEASDDERSQKDARDEELGLGGASIDPYTLHNNPVFIATKAIYLSLKRSWERLAADAAKVSQPLAVSMLTSLCRGEEQAVLGVQALDLGDFAMAVSLLKRALDELDGTLALMTGPAGVASRGMSSWSDDALPRLFDLREIWLRVMAECRVELGRRIDDET